MADRVWRCNRDGPACSFSRPREKVARQRRMRAAPAGAGGLGAGGRLPTAAHLRGGPHPPFGHLLPEGRRVTRRRHGAFGHDVDEVGAVVGGGVHVVEALVGGHRDAGDGLRAEVGGQRLFHGFDAEHAVAGAGDRHAHGPRPEVGHEDAGHGVARGGVGELGVAGALGRLEADGRDDLVVGERGLEHAGEVVVGRDLALVGDDGGLERQQCCRIVGGRVVVGDGAADGAAVAHMRVADMGGELGQRRDRPAHGFVRRHVGVRGAGLDGERAAFRRDARQPRPVRSMTSLGVARRCFIVGMMVMPPAISLASGAPLSSFTASATEVGR
jgi:hypothetical protein